MHGTAGAWVRPALAALLACGAAAQEPTWSDCAAVRDRVLPTAEEEAWRRIGWRDTLGRAVLEADRRGLPVLLWAMNGHPLGGT